MGNIMDNQSSNSAVELLSKLATAGEHSREQAVRTTLEKIMGLIVSTGLVEDPELASSDSNEIKSSSDLGALIAARRKDKRLTQEGLSDLSDISVGTIKNIESGGNARIETILTVTRVLGMNLLCQK
jgi:DNA-binding XRE family transcriptional regulator